MPFGKGAARLKLQSDKDGVVVRYPERRNHLWRAIYAASSKIDVVKGSACKASLSWVRQAPFTGNPFKRIDKPRLFKRLEDGLLVERLGKPVRIEIASNYHWSAKFATFWPLLIQKLINCKGALEPIGCCNGFRRLAVVGFEVDRIHRCSDGGRNYDFGMCVSTRGNRLFVYLPCALVGFRDGKRRHDDVLLLVKAVAPAVCSDDGDGEIRASYRGT